jgi:hypothetical protein
MLMAEITESFDDFLARTVRKLIPRLLMINGETPADDDEDDRPGEDHIADLLVQLRMAVRLRSAVDDHIRVMVVTSSASEQALLDEVLGVPPPPRPTWQEIGEALGVSAQAAHRKYGKAAQRYRASRRAETRSVSDTVATTRTGGTAEGG